MLIEVTQQDIDAGIRNNGNLCPVALAASRAFGRKCNMGFRLIVDGIGYIPAYDVYRFMDAFDLYGPKGVTPFSFEL